MSDTVLWYTTRGAGAVSLVLLSAVVVLGILSALRVQTSGWPRFLTTGLHRNLALMTLVFLAPHRHCGGGPVHAPRLARRGGSLLLLLPDLLARPRDDRVRAAARHRRHQPRARPSSATARGAMVTGCLTRHGRSPSSMVLEPAATCGRPGCSSFSRVHCGGRHLGRLSIDEPARRDPLSRPRRRSSAAADRRRKVEPPRLLAGRDLALGQRGPNDHLRRMGRLPAGGPEVIEVLARSGLTGRGGAAFPVGLKWRSVAAHSSGTAVIVVNGAEGEPRSKKDRLLMTSRPHLILDGAFLAARAVRAKSIVLYIGEEHHAATHSMSGALAERSDEERRLVRTVSAPARYVAGTSSAAVHLVNEGIATPLSTPPSAHVRGIDGAPTLVQNVETLAHVALIARERSDRHRCWSAGMAGGVKALQALACWRSSRDHRRRSRWSWPAARPNGTAVLVGGYFGQWIDAGQGWELPLDPDSPTHAGLRLAVG